MDAQKRETLCAAGIDVDAALERLIGSDALLERFLKKFAADANYARLQAAFEQSTATAPSPPRTRSRACAATCP